MSLVKILPIKLSAMLLVLLVISPSTIFAEGPRWNANTATVEAPGIIVQFLERKPQYKFWIPGENGAAVYIVIFHKIVEFEDRNNDGIFDPQDTILAEAELTAHDVWNIYAETLSGPNGSTEIRIIMKGLIDVIPKMGPGVGKANVTFVNHIYDRDVEIDGYTVAGNRELKIEIIISDWLWHSDTAKLCLEVIFAGHFRGRRGTPHCEEHRIQVRNQNIREIRMRGEDMNMVGVFRFRERVCIREGEQERFCNVNCSHDFQARNAIEYIVYPHFEGVLEHDPSILIEKETTLSDVIIENAPYILLVAILVIVAVVIVVKVRKK